MKEKILIAALELAQEKGLGRISMSQIAQRVGLKKSSLYSHYSSKEEIITSMYSYFRNKAKESQGNEEVDYGKLVEGKSLYQVLSFVVSSYRNMNSDPHMQMFYKVIESERAINSFAAQVMVQETQTMIRATKNLFYALEIKNVAHFENPDAAALIFAMGVHSILEYEYDLKMSDLETSTMMQEFIEEFSRKYKKEGNTNA